MVSLAFPMVFSVAQSLNPKVPKHPKLVGAPNTFGNFGFPFVWFFSRNPKKHMELFDFQQKSETTHGIFWILKFPKVLGVPTSLNILEIVEILDFLRFWYVVTTKSPLVNKLVVNSLYSIISGHVVI